MRTIIRYLCLTFTGGAVACLVAGVIIHAQEHDAVFLPNTTQQEEGIYRSDDWTRYFNLPEYTDNVDVSEEKDNEIFETDGNVIYSVKYGKSRFLRKNNKLYPGDEPVSRVIEDGLTINNDIRLLMQGHAGKRLTVYIDHDSARQNEEENKYVIQYRAVKDDEVIRELNAGDVDIHVAKSKYAVFDSRSEKAYGVDLTLRKDDFTFKAFSSIAKGNNEVEVFKGGSTGGSISIAEYQFVRDVYFQIEPYRRFDGITSAASVVFPAAYSLITFTSMPASPAAYSPYTVSIEKGSVEIWMDDQTGVFKSGIFPNPPDNGKYVKMNEGTDFSVSFATGEITFIRSVEAKSRIFVLYRLTGGAASSDPAVRDDIVTGKHFVFIKYGTAIEEDLDHDGTGETVRINDGVVNHDIYEIRSRYYLGERKILPDNFSLKLYNENSLATNSDILSLGRYEVAYQTGTVMYYLREPFRSLFDSETAKRMYGPLSEDLYKISRYTHRVSYNREARNFQLKQANLVEGSVSVKVNGAVVSPSLYSVNYIGGLVEFPDPNNPVIGETSIIEIRYQYTEQGQLSKSFVGGFRGDYQVNNALSVGGTFLYSRTGLGQRVPSPGGESEQLFVYEGDASLNLSPAKLGSIVRSITGSEVNEIPVEIKGYAEYARSYRNTNTFGSVMIDDIEMSGEALSVSMSEKEWVLSSMPNALPQNQREMLLYRYYRKPSDPETLFGETFTPYNIPYTTKPGPYNIKGGHVQYADGDRNDDRRSLVFDANFSSGSCATAAVRLGNGEVDLSDLQYIEVWYRSGVSTAGSVNLQIDVGTINEDGDGDGKLDTEDLNYNGYLDIDNSNNVDEDIGFLFNPAAGITTRVGGGPKLNSVTKGDGFLSSEDLNRNGMLETGEQIVSFPGPRTICTDGTMTVALNDTTWRRARIYVQKGTLTESDRDALAHAVSLRLSLTGGGVSSRVWIDSIKLVSSHWSDARLNGTAVSDTTNVKASIVDTWNDTEYNDHSFVKEKRSLYQSLYGDKTNDEMHDEKESSLSLEYMSLSGGTASVGRAFPKPIDLRYYRSVSFWYNPRLFTSGDVIRVYLGSSENDYVMYSVPVVQSDQWQEASLSIKGDSSDGIMPTATVGYPDFSHLRIIRFEMQSSGSGRIWFNIIRGTDPMHVKGSAYWHEWSIRGKRPIYITDAGTPLFDKMFLSYVQRMNDGEFMSPGRTDSGMSELVRELRGECAITPKCVGYITFTQTNTESDSFDDRFSLDQRGKIARDNAIVQIDYLSDRDFIPSIGLYYNGMKSEKRCLENGMGSRSNISTDNVSHAPRISIDEKFTDFINGKWRLKIVSEAVFTSEKVITTDIAAVRDGESRQKESLKVDAEYTLNRFVFSPSGRLYSHEVVKYYGRSSQNGEILSDIGGGFRIPFFGDGESKYAERTMESGWKMRLADIDWISPTHTFSYLYNQNTFKDFTGDEIVAHPSYERTHSAQGSVISEFVIPFISRNISSVVKSVNTSFKRSSTLDETNVPYEGENRGLFNERYGVERNFSKTAPAVMNIFKYHPFYFLRGRGNFAKVRDYLESTGNGQLHVDDNRMPYTNTMRFHEEVSCSPSFEKGPFNVGIDAGYSMLCERIGVSGVPSQLFSVNYSNTIGIDLMKLFSSHTTGFLRSNEESLSYHKARIDFGYAFIRRMIITSNIREDQHSPTLGLVMGWDTSSVTIKGGIDFRFRKSHAYIPWKYSDRSRSDDIYINAMSASRVLEKNRGYTFSVLYEREVESVYNFFSNFYTLSSKPLFSIGYDLILNRYDYSTTVSPEPYDCHILTAKLMMDIHKNVKGGITGKMALERWYNRDTHGLYRSILTREIGGQISVVF
jgi:hypothetical protein